MGPTRPTAEYFFRGLWGWLASTWVKLGIVWNYADRWVELKSHTKVGAGSYAMDFTVVPAGYVYTLQTCAAINMGTNASIGFFLAAPTGTSLIKTIVAPGKATWYVGGGFAYTLKAGDFLRVMFYGCSDADVLYATVWGSMMKVA